MPDYAHLTTQLRGLLKKDVAFQWLPDHEAGFTKIKQCLTSSLIVKPFDPALPTELLTDASRLKGIGYALLQRHADGTPRLIQCGSRSLTGAESRYATNELECLAIQQAIEDSRYYLQGCKFVVLTDHRPLVGTFEKPLGEIQNARLLRFREKLASYTFEVIWTPGKTHYIADALSRAPVFDPVEEENECNMLVGLTGTAASDKVYESLSETAAADQTYQQVLEALLQGKRPRDLPPTHPAKLYSNVWEDLSVQGKLLVVDGRRIVVPFSSRREILNALHFSHCGIVKTKKLARDSFYWPGLTNDIKQLVENCEQCQQIRPSQQQDVLQHFPAPPRSHACRFFRPF